MSKNANLDAVNAARAQGDFQNALLLIRRFGLAELEPMVLAERSLDESERASDAQQKERLARDAIDHCKVVLAKDGTHREALMLSGRAKFRVGDYDDALTNLRAAALLRGGGASTAATTATATTTTASTSTAASLRETRQVLLALSVMASLMMRAKQLDVAKQCYERILTLAKSQAGSVAQMAVADAASLGAIESALFQLPRLEKLSGGSASKIVAAMRNALAAPVHLSRNGAAMRALLLYELAQMLLVSNAEVKYERFDVPTVAGEVGASAATARRYVPQEVAEETLTLLRLALAEQRLSDVSLSSRTVDAVADDLCLTLLRRAATHELVDVTEYAVRSRAPCDPFAQLQFALALAAAGRHEHAVVQLQLWLDRHTLDNSNSNSNNQPSSNNADSTNVVHSTNSGLDATTVHLLSAKLLLNELRRPHDALNQARAAVQLVEGGHANATSIEQTTRAATAMRAHASLALGVSAAACARAKGNGGQRRQFAHDAMVALRNAARLHPTSASAAFGLALANADARAITPALELARVAVQLRPDAASWNLLALLLSATRRYKNALAVVECGLRLGDNVELLRTQARLQHASSDTSAALNSLARAFATQAANIRRAQASGLDGHSTTMSVSEPSIVSARTIDDADPSKRGVGRAPSIVSGSSRTSFSALAIPPSATTANANANANASSQPPNKNAVANGTLDVPTGGSSTSATRSSVELWLDVAELYCDCGRIVEAEACVSEARTLSHLEPDVLAAAGRVAELRQRIDEAEQLYDQALALDPIHVPSLRGSGRLLLERVIASSATVSSLAPNRDAKLNAANVDGEDMSWLNDVADRHDTIHFYNFATSENNAELFDDSHDIAANSSTTETGDGARTNNTQSQQQQQQQQQSHGPPSLQHQHSLLLNAIHHAGSQTSLIADNELNLDNDDDNNNNGNSNNDDDNNNERRREGVPNSENRARLLLAEHRLRQAVREDPLAHDAWLLLGRVLLASGDAHRASECLFNQLELERSAPVRPFASIHYQI